MTGSRDPAKSRPLSANVKRLMQLSRASPRNEKVIKASRSFSARDLAYCHNQGTIFMEAAAMGIAMEEFAPLYMNSQMAGVFDVSFSVAGGMENDGLSNLLRIRLLLKSPGSIVEALYWIDGIVSNAEEGQNKSLLLSQAYESEELRLPDRLKGLPANENKNIDELSYAYFLGYIYRCECLLHEESSRMVYGAFSEGIMRRAYDAYKISPLSEGDLSVFSFTGADPPEPSFPVQQKEGDPRAFHAQRAFQLLVEHSKGPDALIGRFSSYLLDRLHKGMNMFNLHNASKAIGTEGRDLSRFIIKLKKEGVLTNYKKTKKGVIYHIHPVLLCAL